MRKGRELEWMNLKQKERKSKSKSGGGGGGRERRKKLIFVKRWEKGSRETRTSVGNNKTVFAGS